jgi:hypothetical protein
MTAETVLAALRTALQSHDEQAFVDAYADDAEVIAYSERNRPGSARSIKGRGEIEAWVRDFMSRNLQHSVGDEVIAGDRFAYTERCLYPTGENVVGIYICDVRDGKIVRQVGAEAWDE